MVLAPVEVGEGLVAQTYDLRLGFLSVGVPAYPSAENQMELSSQLKKHWCALQVFHAGHELDREILGELSTCDFLIISGFLTPLWIKAIQSLEKPTMHFGAPVPGCEESFPTIETDFVYCFSQVIRRAYHDGHKKLLFWLPRADWHSQAKAIHEGLLTAWERNARHGMSYLLDFPDENSLSSLLDAMVRNPDFDAVCLRHAAFRHAAQLPEWYSWLGKRRGFIFTPSFLPADFTRQTGFLVLRDKGFDSFMLEYFFSAPGRSRHAEKRHILPPTFIE